MQSDAAVCPQTESDRKGNAVHRSSRRSGWLFSALRVGLAGGMVVALAETVLFRRNVFGAMTARHWADLFSYLFISHAVLALILSAVACLLNEGIGRLLRRRAGLLHSGSVACAAVAVGEALLVVYLAAVMAGKLLPDGAIGAVYLAIAWLLLLIVPAGVLALLHRTFLERLFRVSSCITACVAGVVLLASIIVQWSHRSQLRSADGFWPIRGAAPASKSVSESPPIVLIVFDALRSDRLGCYGYSRPTSPHIDAFAADSVLFTKAMSPAAWTVPSHASMFTGLYPSQHGARFGFDRLWLDDQFLTLAELLCDRGYQTMALSNNPIVSPTTNLTQGFEKALAPKDLGYSASMIMTPFFIRILGRVDGLASILGRWFIEDLGGGVTSGCAARWLAQRDRSRPFLLFVNFMETHDPYQPKIAYRKRFVRPEDLPRSFWSGLNDDTIRWQYTLAGTPVLSPRDIAILSDLYDARVREADDHFADLMRVLAEEINLDEAVVVVTSDHGENLGEHGMLGHQMSIHNTLIHVPLMIRWPKALKPQRIDRLVQTLDLFPTLLSWAGVEPRQSTTLMTRSLAAALHPTTQNARRYGFAEYLGWTGSELEMVKRLNPDFDPSRWEVSLRAVFDDQWKLVMRTGRAVQKIELFDWTDDRGENRDLSVTGGVTVGRLAKQFDLWKGSFTPFDPRQFTRPPDRRLQEEQQRRLRDLGYVQ